MADYLGVEPGTVHFEPFPDGEIYAQIMENVRGRDVFVLQTVARDPNNYLMELLILIDALTRASAKSVAAVIPYFGYARQDRKDKPRVPITAKLVANLLMTSGADRVLTMDLHAGQIQGFFDIPVDNLYATPLLADVVKRRISTENLVVLAPDLGAIKKARDYASHLGVDYALIDKKRVSTEKVEVMAIIGDVKGRDVLLVDDMCSTAGTMVTAAKACHEAGAEHIYASFTHALLVGNAEEKLANSYIEKIFCSNTVPLPEGMLEGKIEVISVAPLLGEAIRCILSAESISSLFN